jgi:hypothetical protein
MAMTIPEYEPDSVSATTLKIPGMYTRQLEYSKMNERWLCWQTDDSGDTLVRVDSSRLLSVFSRNGLHSR